MTSMQTTAAEVLDIWGDENYVTADEVTLVEDLQEIQQQYSRRSLPHEPLELLQPASLDIWGYDLSQRLNDGDVTVENVLTDFHASLDDQDHLAFGHVGPYSLSIERDDAGADWAPVVHTDDATD